MLLKRQEYRQDIGTEWNSAGEGYIRVVGYINGTFVYRDIANYWIRSPKPLNRLELDPSNHNITFLLNDEYKNNKIINNKIVFAYE